MLTAHETSRVKKMCLLYRSRVSEKYLVINGMDPPIFIRLQRARRGSVEPCHKKQEGLKMHVTLIGIDLAKNVFELRGVNAKGSEVFRKRVRRGKLLSEVGRYPGSIVAFEACGGASLLETSQRSKSVQDRRTGFL